MKVQAVVSEPRPAEVLRSLVEAGQIELARQVVVELARLHPDDGDLQHWKRVLAPPLVSYVSLPPAPSREADFEWLRGHAGEHEGEWVALAQGNLLAASPDLAAVLQAVREGDPSEVPLIHYVARGSG